MIEEDPVAGKHTVGLAVVYRLPEAVDFGTCVRAAWMERRALLLWNFDGLAIHLA